MNGVQVKMQLDTGASLSVISEGTYSTLRDIPRALLEPNTELRTYSSEVIQLLGKLPVNVRFDNQEVDLSKVFSSELSCLRGTEIKLHIHPQAKPKFHKARAVPYALKGLVEKELESQA